MKRTDVVIIGGGQAGLAMSRCLTDENIEHVVLERGRVAQRWRSERWDSLRLLTPNWQSRLPGFRYAGPDPGGFMTLRDVVDHFESYARSFAAPVVAETSVLSLEACASGYRVVTDRGQWLAGAVVIATGATGKPNVPAMASSLDPRIHQLVPTRYKNPASLPDGGVLVVGASASGLQLAEEIHASGRPVTLAVGRHTRLPRRYRGHDILWWLDTMGVLTERAEDVPNLEASKNQPSMQLVGRPDHRSLDLAVLAERGVRLTGRVTAADGNRIRLSNGLCSTVAAADAKLARLLDRIDRFAARRLAATEHDERPLPVTVAPGPRTLDLERHGIRTVLWATGFSESYPWLKLPLLDPRGRMVHCGGVTKAPGVYVLGLRFLRKRNSNFIDGVGDDARALARQIAKRLHGPTSAAA